MVSLSLTDGTNRMTWTPLDNGYVRQHWEVTSDGGTTWSTAFDGEYHPADSSTELAGSR